MRRVTADRTGHEDVIVTVVLRGAARHQRQQQQQQQQRWWTAAWCESGEECRAFAHPPVCCNLAVSVRELRKLHMSWV